MIAASPYVLRLPRLPDPLLKSAVGSNRWAIARAKAADTEYAMMYARKERLWPSMPWSAVDMHVTLYFTKRRNRDEDNYHAMLKGFIDGIVRAHIITDDNTTVIRGLTIALTVDKTQAPATEITLTEIQQEA